jgi:hypothetical protein
MAGKLTIRFSAASMDDHLETPIPGEAQPPGIQPSWKSAPPHPQRQEPSSLQCVAADSRRRSNQERGHVRSCKQQARHGSWRGNRRDSAAGAYLEWRKKAPSEE